MNAYELADELDGWSDHWLSDKGEDDVFKAHATMLRQQADTIYKHMELITELRKECNARADQIAELEKENELLNAKLMYMFEQELKSARKL